MKMTKMVKQQATDWFWYTFFRRVLRKLQFDQNENSTNIEFTQQQPTTTEWMIEIISFGLNEIVEKKIHWMLIPKIGLTHANSTTVCKRKEKEIER